MSIKNRLDKLERDLNSGQCPHQPIRVWYGDDGSGEPREDAEPQIEPCPCGLPSTLLVVEYDSAFNHAERQ